MPPLRLDHAGGRPRVGVEFAPEPCEAQRAFRGPAFVQRMPHGGAIGLERRGRVARPGLVMFVGDALAGNDAVEQAREFNKVVGIDGVILTKVDADAKGGAALSVAYTIGKPLLFVGTGQGYDDQELFDAEWMVQRLFGGDEEAEVEA